MTRSSALWSKGNGRLAVLLALGVLLALAAGASWNEAPTLLG
jgi:hypothetical protein